MPVGNNICNQQGSAKIIMVCNSQPKESFLYNSIRHKYFRKMRWMEYEMKLIPSLFLDANILRANEQHWKNSSEVNNNKNMILSVTEVWDCNFCVFFSAKERSLFRIKQIRSECKQKNTQEKWTCTLRKITLFCFIRLKKNNKIMISWTPNTYLQAFVQNVFADSFPHVQKCLKKKREATWVHNIVVELNN